MRFIAIVSDAFGGRGGIAKFNRYFFTALCNYPKVQEVLCLPRVTYETPFAIPEKLNNDTRYSNNKFKYLCGIIMLLLSRQKSFDLIICGHIHLLPVAYLLKIVYKIPLCLVIHGAEAWQCKTPELNKYSFNFAKSWIFKKMIKCVDCVISVSSFTAKRFVKWTEYPSDKIYILSNCVDLQKFKSGPKPEKFLKKYGLEREKVILTVGRLAGSERLKGFEKIIAALPGISRRYPAVRYIIAGEGDDRARLEAEARRFGVLEMIIFTDFVEEIDLPDLYRVADVYAMPSKGEGFGIVFLEALASGLSVIGSKLDASQEVLQDGKYGWIVNPDNISEIEEAILAAFYAPRIIGKDQLQQYSFEQFCINSNQIIRNIIK